jgi:hypothetical protein
MDTQGVIIHARFAPNAAVVEISERPASLTPQEWFNFLSDSAGDVYQTFAGGRGVFWLTRDRVDGLKEKAVPAGA